MNKIYFVKEDTEEIQLQFTAYTPPGSKNYDRTPLSVGIEDIKTTINSIESNKRYLDKSKVKLTNINYSIFNNSITEVGSVIPSISYNPDTIQIIYNDNENITNKTTITFHSSCGTLTINLAPVIPPPTPGSTASEPIV